MKKARLVFFIIMVGMNAWAAGPQGNDIRAERIARDFEKAKKTIEEDEIKQRKILAALYEINKKTKKIVEEKGTLSRELSVTQAGIQKLAMKTEELTEKASAQKALLAERLRAIYRLGGQSVARIIFSSENSSQLERNLKILGMIAKRDLSLIREYNRTTEDLKRRKEKLVNRLAHLKKIENKIQITESNFKKEAHYKKAILDGIRKNKAFMSKQIEDMREKSMEYHIEDAGLFDLLFKPSFAEQKGELSAPVEGRLVKRFGIEKESDHPYVIANRGIFIETGKEKSVKAVFDGAVAFAGDLPGFGKSIIIDHGDHYYTVYSNNSALKVSLGEEIKRDQIISISGEGPLYPRKGTYFEVRHFSEPYDPQKWMKGL